MNPLIIAVLAILIAIGAIFLAIRFGKHFIKLFSAVLFVVIIALIIYIFVIVDDGVSFKKGMLYEPNLFLLSHDGEITSSFILKPVDKRSGVDVYKQVFSEQTGKHLSPEALKSSLSFTVLNDDVLRDFNRYYLSGNFEALSDSYHRILIINSSYFKEHKDEKLLVGDFELSVAEILNIINSDSPSSSMVNFLASREGMNAQDVRLLLKNQLELNLDSFLFGLITTEVSNIRNRDMVEVFDLIESGYLEVYPNSQIIGFFDGMSSDAVSVFFDKMAGSKGDA
jgi:hypothetical protein